MINTRALQRNNKPKNITLKFYHPMNKFLKSAAFLLFAATLTVGFTACSSDNTSNGDGDELGEFNDQNTYNKEVQNQSNTDFSNKQYGNDAISKCKNVEDELKSANNAILMTKLSDEQETYLKEVIAGVVDNVIIPTYTDLADKTEKLEAVLNGLDVNTITQEQVNQACEYFGEARVQWERSEAFLGGAASDFSIDPTIDSWPLSRSALHTYLAGNMNAADLEDESILGFHALEFILFRNGQPRNVSEFRSNDTYKDFEDISGASELTYAQQVCKLLKERTFQLQVAWEGETAQNASRREVVAAAKLSVKTEKGLYYGEDIKAAGSNNSKYSNLKDAVSQLLSNDEGSALAIANEVGSAKIANPFSAGDISYVESPYSYRSIIDFQDNIRSIRNVWYGNTTGERDANNKSFYTFFARTGNDKINENVINAFVDAINAIGAMPAPFVKYCCTVWDKVFEDYEYVEEDEE